MIQKTLLVRKTQNMKIEITFKLNEVEVTHYTIKKGQIGSHFTSWTLEISDDGNNWTVIDSRSDISIQEKDEETFSVNQNKSRFVSFLRFNNIGFSASPNCEFSVRCIEFFGRLKNRS